MEVSRELLFFFSALGAFNGLVLSLYFLLFAKPKHQSNIFLGAFLLMLSIRVSKSVFFYFNPYLSYNYLQFGLTACLFIGPFLYFYIYTLTKRERLQTNLWKYHLTILLAIALIIGYLYPFKDHVELWRPHIIKSIYTVWFLYILASFYLIKDKAKKITHKDEKLSSTDFWLFSILIGNIILVASYYFNSFVNYISGALTFSFLLYLMLLFVFFNKKKKTILFKKDIKYADKKIDKIEANKLLSQLNALMEAEELYKDANLKSSEVAKKVQLTTHQFSKLLNDNFKKNFPLFINEYRIEAAKYLLKTNTNLTLEAIGYECGFNSKSTFFTTFKKLACKTPAQFKNSL